MSHDIASIQYAFVFDLADDGCMFLYAVSSLHKFMRILPNNDHDVLNCAMRDENVICSVHFKSPEAREILEKLLQGQGAYFPAHTPADVEAFIETGEMPPGWYPAEPTKQEEP